ncbi:DAK2 domain-containing protein [Nocardia sp. NPDC058658]|uniref:DAK2 domain-containing protein n=1 Tax=Nocardia sp. NPDC058658 TaxID=3346580 RepID=UPI0036589284
MRESLDGPDLLVWARNCRTDLELRRAEIDALNVFPIADSDTGTNLLATMRAAVATAERAVTDARSAGVVASGDQVVGDARAFASPGDREADGRDVTIAKLGVLADADADADRAEFDGAEFDRAEADGVEFDGVEADGGDAHRADEPCVDDHRAATEGADLAVTDEPSPHFIAQALARGATAGARGNSGIILSQVLRGVAEAVVTGPLTGERLREALRRSAVLVRTGLSAPVEGTILTVLDRAAVAAAESADQSLVTVARAAADGAARALSETPTQLGVLRAAGVVDAGARGLLVLLDCLVAEVCGEPPERVRYTRGERAAHGPHRRSGDANTRADRHTNDTHPAGDVADRSTSAIQQAGGVADRRTVDTDSAGGRADGESRPWAGAPDGVTGHAPEFLVEDASRRNTGKRPGDIHHDVATSARRYPDAADRGGRNPEVDHDRREQTADPHFEVMYVISGTDDAAAGRLRDRLAVLGDSVVVVGDGAGTWSAHVHCRDAGAAIEAGLAVGTVTAIRIESFAVTAPLGGHHELHIDGLTTQDAEGRDGARENSAPHAGGADSRRVPHVSGAGDQPARPGCRDRAQATEEVSDGRDHRVAGGDPGDHDVLADRGVLAVAAGAAAARLFEDAGATVLRGDRQVDTSTLLRAIRAMPNREVLVLPNGALPAQELVAVGVAARDDSRDVLLLPSSSMVQGLAALAVHDRGRIAVDDAFAMSEAAATTRWGALRAARVRALTMVGMCSPGDGLGLVGHDVVVIDPDVVGAGRILLDRMLGLGGELVTLLMGADSGPELAQVLAEHVTAGFPGVEVVVYSGGQQADLVQIGVE